MQPSLKVLPSKRHLVFLLFFLFPTVAFASSITYSIGANNSVTLSWSCVGSYCLLKQGNTTLKNSPGGTSDTYVVTLPPGTHRFHLYSYKAGGTSGPVLASTNIIDIPISASLPTVQTVMAPTADADGDFTVIWTPVVVNNVSIFYMLEQKLNSGAWQQIYSGTESRFAAIVPPGNYAFRVKACNGSICGDYKTSGVVVVSANQVNNTSRVIFIHTDLLSSPAAETTIQGDEHE